jgi:hypothetical protein
MNDFVLMFCTKVSPRTSASLPTVIVHITTTLFLVPTTHPLWTREDEIILAGPNSMDGWMGVWYVVCVLVDYIRCFFAVIAGFFGFWGLVL